MQNISVAYFGYFSMTWYSYNPSELNKELMFNLSKGIYHMVDNFRGIRKSEKAPKINFRGF